MIGCIAAVASSCVIGRIWFSGSFPTGRVWMRRAFPGKTEKEINAQAGTARALSIVANATLALLLRFILIDHFHATSLLDGVKYTVGLSCLSALLEIPHVLFANGHWDLFLINQTYNLMVMATAGLSIVCFR